MNTSQVQSQETPSPEETTKKRFLQQLFLSFYYTDIVINYNGWKRSTNIWKYFFSTHFPFDDYTIQKYFEKVDWYLLLRYNRNVHITASLKDYLFNKVDRYTLKGLMFTPPFHPLSNLQTMWEYYESVDDFMNKMSGRYKNLYTLSYYFNKNFNVSEFQSYNLVDRDEMAAFILSCLKGYDWDRNFIEDKKDKLNWDFLSMNTGIPFRNELVVTYSTKWNWKHLSQNPSIQFTVPLINKFKEQIDWASLSSNKGEFWSNTLIETYISNWDWKKLCLNPSIDWTLSRLTKYEKYIDWKAVSANPKLEFSYEVLDTFKDKLFWNGVEEVEIDLEDNYGRSVTEYEVVARGISSNKGFVWSKEYMIKYADYLDWEYIANHNRHLCWDIDMIFQFKDKLPWSVLFFDKRYMENEDSSLSEILDNMGGLIEYSTHSSTVSGLKLSQELVLSYYHVFDIDKVFQNRYIEWSFPFFQRLFVAYFNSLSQPDNLEFFRKFVNYHEGIENKAHLEKIEDLKFPEFFPDHSSARSILYEIANNQSIFDSILKPYLTQETVDVVCAS